MPRQASRHGALPCVRTGSQRHTRRLDTRHQAMLGYRDQAGVQHLALGAGWFFSEHEKPEVIGEIDLSDQVIAQIVDPGP
jgi:hypothetical protein